MHQRLTRATCEAGWTCKTLSPGTPPFQQDFRVMTLIWHNFWCGSAVEGGARRAHDRQQPNKRSSLFPQHHVSFCTSRRFAKNYLNRDTAKPQKHLLGRRIYLNKFDDARDGYVRSFECATKGATPLPPHWPRARAVLAKGSLPPAHSLQSFSFEVGQPAPRPRCPRSP